jgi:hypothetical protein
MVSFGSEQGPIIGGYGHQTVGVTQGRKCLDHLNDNYHLMKNSAPLSVSLSLFNNAFSAEQIKRTGWEDDSE